MHTVPVTRSGQAQAAPEVRHARTGTLDLDAVVGAVAHGDRTAFADLYDALSPVVHGIVRRVLRDPDHAADVAQEVMLELWREAPRYDRERGSVHAWVATTAHRRAVDGVRTIQAQRTRDDQDATTASRPPDDAIVEAVEDRADKDLVHDCLSTLTDAQRTAVMLAYFGGRTYREVADELGAALPTVKIRIRDGLNRLRTCLGVE